MNKIPKDQIVKVIEIFYPHAKIYLFGSRARNDNTEQSDIDIAIDIGESIPLSKKAKL